MGTENLFCLDGKIVRVTTTIHFTKFHHFLIFVVCKIDILNNVANLS